MSKSPYNYNFAKPQKTARQIERHFKGVANAKRIDMLMIIHQHPSVVLDNIVERLNLNYQTASDHVGGLILAGLISKKRKDKNMEYTVTPYGKIICEFIRKFMNIK